MKEMNFNKLIENYLPIITQYAINIVTGIAILIIGLWVIKKINKIILKGFEKSKLDTSLQKFLSNLITWSLKILLGITVLNQLGVATTSFVAILGAAGLAVGLALQGTLANFAGGALIMFFKPFKIGDLIEAQGELGVVKEIEIFVTKIVTPDNKLSIIPNGTLSNGNIKNYTEEGMLRVDLTIGISYDSDIKLAKDILEKTMLADPKVLKTPAPSVNVANLGDSGVDLAIRPFATPDDYWDVYFNTLESCKAALDNANIRIPFPQRDVHITTKN